jgi:hypothetical protein
MSELLAGTALPAGVPGVFVTGAPFESMMDIVAAHLGHLFEPEAPVRLGAPPVISVAELEKLGYPETFPHLLGTVHAYAGDEAAWRSGDRGQEATDLAVLPAVCYHVYPHLAGQVLPAPVVVDISGYCFRNERTTEPGRRRSFRMRELIRVDAPDELRGWRTTWLDRLSGWLGEVGVPVVVEPATDPFFGDGQRLIGRMQRAEELKLECVGEVADGVRQALLSGNLHKDHFSAHYGFSLPGGPAYTGCFGIGVDRIVLALLHRHGEDPRRWPAALRTPAGSASDTR